jgi:hypothetical protein
MEIGPLGAGYVGTVTFYPAVKTLKYPHWQWFPQNYVTVTYTQ